MLNAAIYLLLGILILTSFLMVLIVLMQRPKNEGLGAAFGGGMTQDLFGAQTTNVLQKFTVYLGVVFFGSCLLLTVLYSKSSTRKSEIQKSLAAAAATKKIAPAASPTPTAAATAVAPAASTPTAPATAAETPATAPEVTPPAPAEAATPQPTPAAPIVPPPAAATPAEAPSAEAPSAEALTPQPLNPAATPAAPVTP